MLVWPGLGVAGQAGPSFTQTTERLHGEWMAAAKRGGLAAAERVLVDAVLTGTSDAAAWFNLGTVHAEAGRDRQSASALWAALEALERQSTRRPADIAAVSARMQAAFMHPPGCARLLCPAARGAGVFEKSEQVSACLPGAEIVSQHVPWPSSTSPWISSVRGPLLLTPLAGDHARAMVYVKSDRASPCWVHPNEHMSFTLFARMRARGSVADLARAFDAPGQPAHVHVTVPRAASVLHALGTSNPFHFVRDGVASLLLLLHAERGADGAREFLVPDAPRWRSWTSELRLDRQLDSTAQTIRYVARGAHVLVDVGTTISFVDWRRPEPPSRTSLWGVDHVAAMSGAAIALVRRALEISRDEIEISRVEVARRRAVAVEPSGAASEAAGAESETESDGATSSGGDVVVVYVSRNDTHVRRVEAEGALLADLRASAAGGRSATWRLEAVEISRVSLAATRSLLGGASVVVGPHGAGLYNAPLFAPRGCVLVPFGLDAADASKEDNLRSACDAVGMAVRPPPGVSAAYVANYSLGPGGRASVVSTVADAVALSRNQDDAS